MEKKKDIHGPHLLVVPASTFDNWQNEIRTWSPTLSNGLAAYRGTKKMKEEIRGRNKSSITIILTTYNMFEQSSGSAKDDRTWLRKFKFQTMICDEAHGLKNVASNRHQNLEAMDTKHRLLLTGTPMQNNISELLAVLRFCMPHVFSDQRGGKKKKNKSKYENGESDKPRFQAFADYFEAMDQVGDDGAKENALSQIRTIMKPFVLRRLKQDVLGDLSPKVSHTILLPMNDAFQQTYRSVLQRVKDGKLAKKQLALEEAAEAAAEAAVAAGGGGGAGRKRLSKKNKLLKKNSKTKKIQSKKKTNIDPKNIYTELRKAANHPILLLRHFQPYLDDIIDESYRLNLFGDETNKPTKKTVRDHLTAAKFGNDFRLGEFCQEYASESKLLSSLHSKRDVTGSMLNSPKLNWLRKHLPTMYKEGHRILLFSQWTTLLDLMELFLQNIGEGDQYLRLDGSTTVNDRQNMIDQFNQKNSKYRTFLLSTRAGGMGINLASADTVILHDLDPNPTLDKQAEDRAHRMGQTKQVTVYRLVMEGTVDQQILQKSIKKDILNTSVLEDNKVPDPFADATDTGGGGSNKSKSMKSLIELALKQQGMLE